MAKKVVPITPKEAVRVQTLIDNPNVESPAIQVAKVPVKVIDEKPGPVTWKQKLAKYYKGLIVSVGTLLAAVNEIAPVVPHEYQGKVTTVILALTALGTILKGNQHWLPDSAVQ